MSKTYNIGVIGFGSRARAMWTQSFSTHGDIEGNDSFHLSAITDIMPKEDLDKHLERMNLTDVNLYRDPTEMFEKEKLDGVIIATRCSLHTQMALLAAKYGVPMLLEKPVCTNEEDLERLCTIVDKMDQKTIISFPLRNTPIARQARDVVKSGILGTISQVQAINNAPYGRGYFHGWYRDDKETGGLFLQKATHDLDLIQFLLGEPRPVMVGATESKMVFKGDMPAGLKCGSCEKRETCPESDINVRSYGDKYGVSDGCCFAVDTGNHDSASIFVRYDTGLHAVYSQNFVARKGSARRGIRIIGYNATMEFEFNTQTLDIFYHNENKTEHFTTEFTHSGSHFGGDRFMIDGFAKMLAGAPSPAPLSLGIMSARLCLAAKKSAQNDIFVKL
jgi:predicted dehydrogenase